MEHKLRSRENNTSKWWIRDTKKYYITVNNVHKSWSGLNKRITIRFGDWDEVHMKECFNNGVQITQQYQFRDGISYEGIYVIIKKFNSKWVKKTEPMY